MDKPHLSVALCGHEGSGKTTTAAQLLANDPTRRTERGFREAFASNPASVLDVLQEEREIHCTVAAGQCRGVVGGWW